MYAFCTYLKQIQTNTYQYLLEVFICIYVHIFAYIFVSKILLLTYSKANRHTFVSICQWTYLHTYSSMPLLTWTRHSFVTRHPESASVVWIQIRGHNRVGGGAPALSAAVRDNELQQPGGGTTMESKGKPTKQIQKCQLQPNRILTSK